MNPRTARAPTASTTRIGVATGRPPDSDGSAAAVGDALALGEGDAVAVGVGLGDAVGVGVGEAVGEGVGVAVGTGWRSVSSCV